MPEKKWNDNEGRQRVDHDENFQMVAAHSEDESVWLKMDSWCVDFACKLILFGHIEHIDKYIFLFRDHSCITDNDRANAAIIIKDRFSKLAQSAINAEILQKYDTPAKWLAWAQSKGYNTDHLIPTSSPQNVGAEVVAEVGAGTEPTSTKAIKDVTTPNERELTQWLRETWSRVRKRHYCLSLP